MKDCVDKRANLMLEIREYKKKKDAILAATCLNFILLDGLDTFVCSCNTSYTKHE